MAPQAYCRTRLPAWCDLCEAWLVSRLQALLQTGRILVPRTMEEQVLAQELQDYEIKVDQDANDKYGAFRVGTHDDLVTALGLTIWLDATGVGQPIVDLLAQASLPVVAVYVTHGDRLTEDRKALRATSPMRCCRLPWRAPPLS